HVPSKLSGGQKQRIAIAGVLAMKPKCIILDEPTAMLDPVGRKEVMKTVHRLNKEENITIILITHYMEEAVQGDRIYVIHDGDVVMEGTPKTIFQEVDQLKSLDLDVPQVTELSYLLRKKGLDLPPDVLTIEEMVGALCQLQSKT
ncbi:MAG: ATP-binding cassette domain-containing protein, partial [Bacillota bacterium]